MSNMTKAELEAELRQARDKICYCECKNKELQERLSAIVAPVQCDTYAEAVKEATPSPVTGGGDPEDRST